MIITLHFYFTYSCFLRHLVRFLKSETHVESVTDRPLYNTEFVELGGTKLTAEKLAGKMCWFCQREQQPRTKVTCARHFDYSVQQFFNTFLKSSVSPFGHMSDFWYRIEFQHRGSPHVHCLLWISLFDSQLYTLWTIKRWQHIFEHNWMDFYNFLHCKRGEIFYTRMKKMSTSPKYHTYSTLRKWSITFHTFIMHPWNKFTCCIKHGVKHKVHQVHRKQIDSHKVSSEYSPQRSGMHLSSATITYDCLLHMC